MIRRFFIFEAGCCYEKAANTKGNTAYGLLFKICPAPVIERIPIALASKNPLAFCRRL